MRNIIAAVIIVLGYWAAPIAQDFIDTKVYPEYEKAICHPEAASDHL